MYPNKLYQAIANGMLRQKEVDESNRVSIGKMNKAIELDGSESVPGDLSRTRCSSKW